MYLVCELCGGLAQGGVCVCVTILVNCIWVFFAEVCLLILSETFIHSYIHWLFTGCIGVKSLSRLLVRCSGQTGNKILLQGFRQTLNLLIVERCLA